MRAYIIILLLFTFDSSAQSFIQYWKKGNKIASIDAQAGLNQYLLALENAEKAGDVVWQAIIRADLCGSYYNLGEYQKALEVCNNGLSLLEKKQIKNDSAKFRLLSSASPCYYKLYRTDEAIAGYEQSGTLLRRHPEIARQTPLFVTYFYVNYAYALIDLFDIEKARVMLAQAVVIAKGLKKPVHYSRVIGLSANLYAFSGEYQKGLSQYRELEKYFKQNHYSNPEEQARAHYMMAYFYTRLSDHSEALKHLDLAKKYGGNLKEPFNYVEMSEIDQCENYLMLGKPAEVKKILDRLPAKSSNLETGYYKAMARGAYHDFLQEYDKALDSYKLGFRVLFPDENDGKFNAEKIRPHKLKLFEVFNRMGNSCQKKYQITKASTDLDLAYYYKVKTIQVGKQIRQFQENMDSKVFFTHKYHDIYQDLIRLGFERVLLRPRDKALCREVFNYAEEAKSVVLTDPLLLRNTVRNEKSDSLLVKLQANQAYLSYLKSHNDPAMAADISQYETKVQELWGELAKNNKNFTDRILSRSPESQLPKKTLYVNYFLNGDALYVFCKDHRQIWMKKLQLNPAVLGAHVRNLRRELTRVPSPFEGFAAEASTIYLYDILIGKALPGIGLYEKIILNPDNSFFDMSFDILKNKKTGKPLIATHAISYASSLSMRNPQPGKFQWSDKKWIALFPFAESSEDLISGLKPLRFSRSDIKGIRSENYFNQKASKSLFVDKLQHKEANPLIIATHASGGTADDPYLYFKSEKESDSRLFASEIRHFDIKTPLVVLSACATHRGKTFGGMGAKSFAMAIHWAGCPSVAATLWEVDDESMSVLTSLFYKNLLLGMPKDEALRFAKLAYQETAVGKAKDLPFYWAHFQVIGSTAPIVSPWLRYLPYLLAPLLGLLLIWVFRKKLFFKP